MNSPPPPPPWPPAHDPILFDRLPPDIGRIQWIHHVLQPANDRVFVSTALRGFHGQLNGGKEVRGKEGGGR
jgi:hypothetical protein